MRQMSHSANDDSRMQKLLSMRLKASTPLFLFLRTYFLCYLKMESSLIARRKYGSRKRGPKKQLLRLWAMQLYS